MTMTIRTLIALFAGLWFSAAVYAATVSVSPTAGPPTTRVTVTGSGFGAGKAVDIYFDTVDKCLAITNASGAFSCAVTVPGDAQPQLHYVSAVERGTHAGAQSFFQVRTDWTQFNGRTAAQTGRNPFENSITAANVGDLDVLWAKPIGSGSLGSTVVYGNNVYVASSDGRLFAFNTTTGATVAGFPKTVGTSIAYTTPSIAGGNVYVPTFVPPALHAFNALTGAPVAGFPKTLPAGSWGSATAAAGKVYVVTDESDQKLHGFNAATGAALAGFPKPLPNIYFGTPTVANDILYVATEANTLHSFDANTGAPIATKTLTNRVATSVSVSGGTVYAASGTTSTSGNFYALSEGTLGTKPGFPIPFPSRGTPAIGRGLVVLGTDSDFTLRAYRTGTPSLVWATPLDSSVFGSPAIAGDVVFVNTLQFVYAVSAASGAVLWRSGVQTMGLTSTTVTNGILFVPSSDGKLYAFSVNGQAPTARLPGGAMGVKPAIGDLKPDYTLVPTGN